MERRLRSDISKEYDLPHIGAVLQREEWMLKSLCRGMDPNLFFPTKGDAETVRAAKTVCNMTPCPVRQECLDYGLRNEDNRRGVYGGMTGLERRAYKRTLYKTPKAS